MRPLALLLVALLIAASARFAEGTTEECSLTSLLAARTAVGESAAAFTQERRIHYVRKPVFSTGRLRYVAPDHLEMVVETPQPESFIYDEGVLTIDTVETEGDRQVSVDSDVMLSSMFSGLLATLSGDEAELRRVFFVDFQDSACKWRLVLVPKSKRVLGKVAEINISGSGHIIEKVEVFQANGDRSILSIQAQE